MSFTPGDTNYLIIFENDYQSGWEVFMFSGVSPKDVFYKFLEIKDTTKKLEQYDYYNVIAIIPYGGSKVINGDLEIIDPIRNHGNNDKWYKDYLKKNNKGDKWK